MVSKKYDPASEQISNISNVRKSKFKAHHGTTKRKTGALPGFHIGFTSVLGQ